MVRASVEETLNQMLEAEADQRSEIGTTDRGGLSLIPIRALPKEKSEKSLHYLLGRAYSAPPPANSTAGEFACLWQNCTNKTTTTSSSAPASASSAAISCRFGYSYNTIPYAISSYVVRCGGVEIS